MRKGNMNLSHGQSSRSSRNLELFNSWLLQSAARGTKGCVTSNLGGVVVNLYKLVRILNNNNIIENK
jgi:hypothetical protein